VAFIYYHGPLQEARTKWGSRGRWLGRSVSWVADPYEKGTETCSA
jgi:hypothetical protein